MNCLVYVDPSERGEWALRLCALLAPRAARLTLLATEEDVRQDADLLARARRSLPPVALEEKRAPGPAERAIPTEVAGRDYDLVIVPPAGRGALARMLKGSRVASVVKSVRASVLVARRPPQHVARILAAVSGGAKSAAVVRAALEMERAFDARASFFHAASEIALPYEPARGETAAPPAADEAARAREAVTSVGRDLIVREGLVVDEILSEVENGAHDLLVAGASSAEPGWGREDVTERILLRCPTSMLIARG